MPASSARPARVPADWPHRDWSRTLRVGDLDWHVQVGGRGPVLVLLHGTGSSTHSWAELAPHLAEVATLVIPDLPGHGYTRGAATGMSLAAMAAALEALLAALGRGRPALVAGHSAGAAVAVRWALDAPRPPRAIVGFNPSLLAPPAVYMRLIAPLVNPLAMSSPFARFVAALGGSDRLVNSLLDATRSDVPAVQRERYARLFRDPVHVRGTMGFMAAADLTTLAVDARALAVPTTFVIGDDDPWVPARPLRRLIARAMPQAKVVVWHGGHVLHEAFPDRAATLLRAALAAVAG